MTPGPTISRLLAAGVLVGVLDGAFAVVLYAYVLRLCSGPQVFQSIAGAVLGPAAFRGGGRTAALGLLLHFTVAGGWTVVYAVLWTGSGRLRDLTSSTRGALAAGAAFGILVWLAMDLAVVPLTLAKPTPLRSPIFAILLAWHAIGVGIPIALIIREPARRAATVPLHA
jgi:hypothetical protein